ncbi:hypothetical protein BX666DRAFT_1434313 [Dichotomocladium elegans]|nr:hypothetical protein BX666DRAFT_1434313 [Dichotomocladium elegans]
MGFDCFYAHQKKYKDRLLLRSRHVSNSPETIRRLGCIGMNMSIEVDMYGHANYSMVRGSGMLNGIGGSEELLRNAKLAIMHTPLYPYTPLSIPPRPT